MFLGEFSGIYSHLDAQVEFRVFQKSGNLTTKGMENLTQRPYLNFVTWDRQLRHHDLGYHPFFDFSLYF